MVILHAGMLELGFRNKRVIGIVIGRSSLYMVMLQERKSAYIDRRIDL